MTGCILDEAPRGLLDELLVFPAAWDFLPDVAAGYLRLHHSQPSPHQRCIPDREAGHRTGILPAVHSHPHEQEGEHPLFGHTIILVTTGIRSLKLVDVPCKAW